MILPSALCDTYIARDLCWAWNLACFHFPIMGTTPHLIALDSWHWTSHLRPGSIPWSLFPILIQTYFQLAVTLEIQDQVNLHLAPLTLPFCNSIPFWEPSWKLQIDEFSLFYILKNFVLCRIHHNHHRTTDYIIICLMSIFPTVP